MIRSSIPLQIFMVFNRLLRWMLTICTIFGLTWYLLGHQYLYFFIFVMSIIVFYVALVFMSFNIRAKLAKVTDERLSITRAIVHGVRVIKMFAWEWPFMDTVQRKRRYATLCRFLQQYKLTANYSTSKANPTKEYDYDFEGNNGSPGLPRRLPRRRANKQ